MIPFIGFIHLDPKDLPNCAFFLQRRLESCECPVASPCIRQQDGTQRLHKLYKKTSVFRVD